MTKRGHGFGDRELTEEDSLHDQSQNHALTTTNLVRPNPICRKFMQTENNMTWGVAPIDGLLTQCLNRKRNEVVQQRHEMQLFYE